MINVSTQTHYQIPSNQFFPASLYFITQTRACIIYRPLYILITTKKLTATIVVVMNNAVIEKLCSPLMHNNWFLELNRPFQYKMTYNRLFHYSQVMSLIGYE